MPYYLRDGSTPISNSIFLLLLPASAVASPRIIGGDLAEPGDWPSMVLLRSELGSGGSPYVIDGGFCGGTLVSSHWVLTAKHCARDLDLTDTSVVVGESDLMVEEGEVQLIQAEAAWLGRGYADIALLRIAEDSPGPYMPLGGKIRSGRGGLVAGWGVTHEDSLMLTPNLREVRVSFIRNKTCRKRKAYGYNFLPKYEICAGTMKGGRDSCKGDSGGPLVRTIKGVRRQVGIVSWGGGCGKRNKLGIYARVSQFLPWIRSVISE